MLSNIVSKTDKTGNKKVQRKANPKIEPSPSPTGAGSSAPASPASSMPNGPKGAELSVSEQKKLEDLIMHAQLEYSKIQARVVREKKREIDALNQQIKEFMGPFMLIGYDLNNNPVEMVSASSPAEHDAILERLRRLMFKINQNIANSGGNDPYGLNS